MNANLIDALTHAEAEIDGTLPLAPPMISRDFALAGNARFTVSSPSGERYTFRISMKEADTQRPAIWFVSLLTGSDNESSYTYIGILNALTGEVRLTAKSRYTDDTKPVKVIRWALGLVWRDMNPPDGYAVRHEGRCARCNRLLTTPDSVDRGIGPECWRLMGMIS